MKRDDPDRCQQRTARGPVYFPQCKYRWSVVVTMRNGERMKLCRVHLRAYNRTGQAVEVRAG